MARGTLLLLDRAYHACYASVTKAASSYVSIVSPYVDEHSKVICRSPSPSPPALSQLSGSGEDSRGARVTMGSGASANPSEPAKGGTAVTTTRRKSLMKNEAMVMSFIKKNIGRATPKIPLGDILKVRPVMLAIGCSSSYSYYLDLIANGGGG